MTSMTSCKRFFIFSSLFTLCPLSLTDLEKNLFFLHDKGPYPIETSPLICFAKQWTGFCMAETVVLKELNRNDASIYLFRWSEIAFVKFNLLEIC